MTDTLFRMRLIWRDPDTGQEKRLDKPMPITIGRREGNNVSISEPTVSRDHASLRLVNGEVYIIDHSTRGTTVNGQLIRQNQRALRHKDSFKIGRCTFNFRQQSRQMRCHNCDHVVSLNKQDCPYCGYALAGSVTVPYSAAELTIDAQGVQYHVR